LFSRGRKMKRTAAGMNGFATMMSNGALEPTMPMPMPMPFTDIEAEALKLTTRERVRLTEHLVASLDADDAVKKAWIAKVERRLREVNTGRAATVPLEVAVKRAPAATSARAGWAEAAKALAVHGGDELVLGEFPNDGDAELRW
jgi:putative addiction module component (TIGR02574 family)